MHVTTRSGECALLADKSRVVPEDRVRHVEEAFAGWLAQKYKYWRSCWYERTSTDAATLCRRRLEWWQAGVPSSIATFYVAVFTCTKVKMLTHLLVQEYQC